MERLFDVVCDLRKGIINKESKLEKDKLMCMKIQIITAINLLADALDFIVNKGESLENNLEQAKAYISTQEPANSS